MAMTAPRLNRWAMHIVEQPDNQLVTNSTVVEDSGLAVPVEEGAVYEFSVLASIRAPVSPGSTAGGFRAAWSVPSGVSMMRWTTGPGRENTVTSSSSMTHCALVVPGSATTEVTVGGAGSSVSVGYTETGLIEGGDAGTCVFRFAQYQAGGGVSAELRAFSRLLYRRID
jgi:hypothetical protein